MKKVGLWLEAWMDEHKKTILETYGYQPKHERELKRSSRKPTAEKTDCVFIDDRE
eukprot:CAMPEP_0119311666 /NCGR_PEP_ID=MMETSP1333-20130426/23317_1 /TAXON_ID=418940 /ORGANISM="Scyphosphaera apsteinii, Strain RCC1455" /LENGTH=54 /DNA_ID=CAMNT_0007316101 /DNA_START=585 /DNA_END=749 /DNA_ORIENTATION=-